MRCLHCLSWITALPRGSPPLPVLLHVHFLLQQTLSGRTNHVSGMSHCLQDIWWLMQQISEYSHNAVVFQELLAMETQEILRDVSGVEKKSHPL